MTKKKNMICLLVCLISAAFNDNLLAQQASTKQIEKTRADIFWESIPQRAGVKNSAIYKEDGSYTLEEKKSNEQVEIYNQKQGEVYARKIRDWGLEFWKKFPADKRRFKWLLMTMEAWMVPYYFKDMDKEPVGKCEWVYEYPVDWEARKQWDKEYQTLRLEFMRSSQVTRVEKVNLVKRELTEMNGLFDMQMCSFVREGRKKFNVADWTRKIMEFAKEYYEVYAPHDSSTRTLQFVYLPTVGIKKRKDETDDAITYAANCIFRLSSLYGVSTKELEFLAQAFLHSPYSNMQLFGAAKAELLSLYKKSFELKYKAVDGSEVDLEKMRGKLVLLDFWSTSCSSCILKMPEVKDVYDKYQSQGFEVVSICGNPEIDKEKVLAIHDRIGADWPLLIIGGQSSRSGWAAPNSLMKKIWSQFGLRSVPQLFLLGRDGRLLEYNGVLVENGKLEEVVKRYL